MTEKIVVAVDRETAHHAPVDWAMERAERTGASVELVLIIQRAWSDREPAPDRLLVAAGEAVLHAHVDYAKRRAIAVSAAGSFAPAGSSTDVKTDVAVSTRWAYGRAAEELVFASRDADLFVIGTHPTGEPDHPFAGSLGLRVAATASCPVVLVPRDWADERKGVVVGVDGNLPSEVALDFAADEAVAVGEPLDIVCAGYSANPLVAGLLPEISEGDRRQQVVDEAASAVHDRYPQLAVAKRVMESSPAAGLVTVSRRHRLLVIGSRGRHGAQLGSVSHGVILELVSPIIVIGPRGRTP
jgi:nucleotide-binding universal stress UspA family protein